MIFEKAVIQSAQRRQSSTLRPAAEPDASKLPIRRPESKAITTRTSTSLGDLAAAASLIPLDHGLYALAIGETAGEPANLPGLPAALIQVSAPPNGRNCRLEIIAGSAEGETWFGSEGGTVIVRSPAGGGQVLVTVYGPPANSLALPEIVIQRLDHPRPDGAVPRPAELTSEPREIPAEIALHIERIGDRRFTGQGWVGNRGKKLRIEAFSIRPLETLTPRDIEFKALGPNRRQTPWVTDAKLCGTRGQGLPLTGFAIRLAPHLQEQFEAVYQGAFFESGIVGPNRNGELCTPPIADDPLEAINVRLIRR